MVIFVVQMSSAGGGGAGFPLIHVAIEAEWACVVFLGSWLVLSVLCWEPACSFFVLKVNSAIVVIASAEVETSVVRCVWYGWVVEFAGILDRIGRRRARYFVVVLASQ